MAKSEKFIFLKANEETDDDVALNRFQIEMLRLLAEGYKQGRIAEKMFRGKRTTHNYFTRLNELTGCHNPQGLVGWAFKNSVLVVINKKIVAAYLVMKKEEED